MNREPIIVTKSPRNDDVVFADKELQTAVHSVNKKRKKILNLLEEHLGKIGIEVTHYNDYELYLTGYVHMYINVENVVIPGDQ